MKKVTILIVIILLIFGVGITYSIYHSNAKVSITDQNIAKFIFNATESNSIELPLADFKPGDKSDYEFLVSNNENGKVSEVTVEYQITIKTYHFMPFIIKLYKIDGNNKTLISECDESYSRNEQNQLVCNVPIQEMGYSIEVLDSYTLEVEFPSQYNDRSYSGLVDFIDLEIKSWQKTED